MSEEGRGEEVETGRVVEEKKSGGEIERMLGNEMEKGVGEESKKKVGRPKKVEELAKQRRGSAGCIEEYLRRKRERGEEEKEEEEWALRRSRKMERLQEGEKGRGIGKEELGTMIREMGEKLMEKLGDELGKLRLEMRQRENDWKEEREKMRESIRKLEERCKMMEDKLEKRIEEGGRGEERSRMDVGWLDETTAEGMKSLRRKIEIREREEKRNNILIRRMEGGEGEIKERVKKMLEEIGVEAEIEWARIVKGKGRKEGDMVVVRLGSREQKRQVMEKKKGLKGKVIRIDDDLTWEERKMKWKIGEIANEERRRGNRVWTAYGRIRINDCWWKWDEEKGTLKNWKGEIRKESDEKGEEMLG